MSDLRPLIPPPNGICVIAGVAVSPYAICEVWLRKAAEAMQAMNAVSNLPDGDINGLHIFRTISGTCVVNTCDGVVHVEAEAPAQAILDALRRWHP